MGRNRSGRFSFYLHAHEMFPLSIARELQAGGGAGLRHRAGNANGRGSFAVSLNQDYTVLPALDVVVTGGKTLPSSNEFERDVNVKGIVGRSRRNQGGKRSRSDDK